MQIAQIIVGKLDLLFIDGQIQQYKEHFYPVIIKSVLEIVLFSTLFAKKSLDISGTRWRLVSLGFSNSKNKSLNFINHERSVDESISKYLQIELSINRVAQSETSIPITLINDHDVCRWKRGSFPNEFEIRSEELGKR